MVSIYCLRPVYTFLYTIINCNVAASFVQQISFEILWYKKIFFGYVRNLELPLPLVRNRTHLAWPLPSPTLGERIMWKTPVSVSQRFRNRCLCWSVGVSLECLCWSLCCLFFDKVAGLMLCNFMKKILQHRSFPVSNAKFLRTYPVADSVSLIKAAIGIASNTMRDGFYKQSL